MNWCQFCVNWKPWIKKCVSCNFELSDDKIIEYAHERAISITEAIALIEFCNSGFKPNKI